MTSIFLDSSSIEQITKWKYIIKGVTTNPSILVKDGVDLEEICALVSPLPVSIEVGGDIYSEANKLRDWLGKDGNLVVKVPFLNSNTGKDNLEVISKLVEDNFLINCTAVLSIPQCLLASATQCRYISVFGGRVEDEGGSLYLTVSSCQEYIVSGTLSGFPSKEDLVNFLAEGQELIVGSIRTIGNVIDCIRAEVDIITVTPSVLEKMTQHENALRTSRQFEEDYVRVDILRGLETAEGLSDFDLEKLVGN